MNRILGLIKEGVAQGAKLVHGGGRHGDEGFFVQPTVFADVEDHHIVAREEVSNNLFPVIKVSSKKYFYVIVHGSVAVRI